MRRLFGNFVRCKGKKIQDERSLNYKDTTQGLGVSFIGILIKMIKKIIKIGLKRVGFELTRKAAKDDLAVPQNECEEMIKTVRENTMVTHPGLVSLYHQALFCETSEMAGDFVECGVWKGGAVGLMALVNLKHGQCRRHIHLFDSFEEICEPDEEVDGEKAVREVRKYYAKDGGTKGKLAPLTGVYDTFGGPGTIDENNLLLENVIGYDRQYIHYHKGWFQHTLPEQHGDIGKIAILRLDADWYASTKICLDFLFEKIVAGGFVIIDDYGAFDGCRKAVDEFIKATGKPLHLNYVNSDIRYIIVP